MNIRPIGANTSFAGRLKYDRIALTEKIAALEDTEIESLAPKIVEGINELKRTVEESTPDNFDCFLDMNYKTRRKNIDDDFHYVSKINHIFTIKTKCKDGLNQNQAFNGNFELQRIGSEYTFQGNAAIIISEFFSNLSKQIVNYANSDGEKRISAIKFKPGSFSEDIYNKFD